MSIAPIRFGKAVEGTGKSLVAYLKEHEQDSSLMAATAECSCPVGDSKCGRQSEVYHRAGALLLADGYTHIWLLNS